MKKNRVEEVLNKMLFLQDDINGVLLYLTM